MYSNFTKFLKGVSRCLGFFRELLSNSRQDLHKMFLRTYGMLYEQNSDIFKSLFDDLTSYYIGNQKIDLDQSVDKFYQQLYRRMFRILNQAYQFDSAYWDCMTRHMEELKPFGDVPVKMKQQVTRAFVAARTFVSGLSTGRDVVRQIMEVKNLLQFLKMEKETRKMSLN